MTRILTIIALLFVTPMLAGCGGSEALRLEALSKASLAKGNTVVIYRGPSFVSGALNAFFSINGQNDLKLAAGKVLSAEIETGPNMVTAGLRQFPYMHTYIEGYEDRPTYVVYQPTMGAVYFFPVARQQFQAIVNGNASAANIYRFTGKDINARNRLRKSAYIQMLRDRKRAALELKCNEYGFQKGTADFSNCLMQQEIAERQQQKIEELKKEVAEAKRAAKKAKDQASYARTQSTLNKLENDRRRRQSNTNAINRAHACNLNGGC